MAASPSHAASVQTARRTIFFLDRELKSSQFQLAAHVRKRFDIESRLAAHGQEETIIRTRVHQLMARIHREITLHPNVFPPSQ